MNPDEAVARCERWHADYRKCAVYGIAQPPFPADALIAVLARLAEFERTRSTGGPAPAETRGWANEAVVPAPETAHDQSMAVPDRYRRSDAHLRGGAS